MKSAVIVLILYAFLIPGPVLAEESFSTDRLQASFENNGNWRLTDTQVNITWRGQWIAENLMRVTGSDDSCFVIGENQKGLVQLDCQSLKEISVLLSN